MNESIALRLVECTARQHGEAIRAIFNEVIANSTALYDYKPRDPAGIDAWFHDKEAGGYPVLGIEDEKGTLLGFASYGSFRPWAAYKYTVEHAVYVRSDQRGRGIGRRLVRALIIRAEREQYHTMIGGIDLDNRASLALHESMGFIHAGTMRQVAFKFGRWLDLAFYQLVLATPEQPRDG